MIAREWQVDLLRLRQRIDDIDQMMADNPQNPIPHVRVLVDLHGQVEALFARCIKAMEETMQRLTDRGELLRVYAGQHEIGDRARALLIDDLFRFYRLCIDDWYTRPDGPKLRWQLTVDELLILLRLMQEVGMMELDQLGAAFSKISQHFSSKGADNISVASLRRKYSTVPDRKFVRLQQQLQQMLDRLSQHT